MGPARGRKAGLGAKALKVTLILKPFSKDQTVFKKFTKH